MAASRQILTVSYGSFSCTLEGFEGSMDDSVAMMKDIAAFFRDIAAEDRDFGQAGTETTELLARHAEREIARRIEARMGTSDLVLSLGRSLDRIDAVPSADISVAFAETNDATGRPASSPAPAMPPAAQAPQAAPDSLAGQIARIRAVAGTAGMAARPAAPPPSGDDAQDRAPDDPGSFFRTPDTDDSLPDRTAPRPGLSADEAAVAAVFPTDDPVGDSAHPGNIMPELDRPDDLPPAAALTADTVLPDATAPTDVPAGNDAVRGDRAAHAIADEGPATGPTAWDAIMPGPGHSAADGTTSADTSDPGQETAGGWHAEPVRADILSTSGDPAAAEPAILSAGPHTFARPMAEPEWSESAGPPDDEPAPAAPGWSHTISPFGDFAGDDLRTAAPDLAEDHALPHPAEAAGPADAGQPQDDDDLPAAAWPDAPVTAAAEPVAPLAEPHAGWPDPAATGDVTAATFSGRDDDDTESAAAAWVHDTADYDEAEDYDDEAEDDEDTGLSAGPGPDDRPDARFIRSEGDDAPADVIYDMDDDSDDAEDGYNDSDDRPASSWDTPPEPEGGPGPSRLYATGQEDDSHWADADSDAAESDAPSGLPLRRSPFRLTGAMASGQGRARFTSPEDDENALERLMMQTDAHMSGPEALRRREAIAQLRAAVAASESGQPIDTDRADLRQIHSEQGFRDDLRDTASPLRNPDQPPAGRGERGRPAPLRLVASQRIDLPTESRALTVVKPPQPIRPRRIRVGQSGKIDAVPVTQPRMIADNSGAPSFAEFAADMGVDSLPDLIEAAAAHTSFIEGLDDFSRPQILNKVGAIMIEATQEEGLRAFSILLREGRIFRTDRPGRFGIAADSRYNPLLRRHG